jgi:hypothetical protein
VVLAQDGFDGIVDLIDRLRSQLSAAEENLEAQVADNSELTRCVAIPDPRD